MFISNTLKKSGKSSILQTSSQYSEYDNDNDNNNNNNKGS